MLLLHDRRERDVVTVLPLNHRRDLRSSRRQRRRRDGYRYGHARLRLRLRRSRSSPPPSSSRRAPRHSRSANTRTSSYSSHRCG